jgi:hypothetical protein
VSIFLKVNEKYFCEMPKKCGKKLPLPSDSRYYARFVRKSLIISVI